MSIKSDKVYTANEALQMLSKDISVKLPLCDNEVETFENKLDQLLGEGNCWTFALTDLEEAFDDVILVKFKVCDGNGSITEVFRWVEITDGSSIE